MGRDYYLENENYTNVLESQSTAMFEKYSGTARRMAGDSGTFLDVGCGTGIALELFGDSKRSQGVELSRTSAQKCIERGLQCTVTDGIELPFPSETFDVVGSYDVLEHTEDPLAFLAESLRVLRPGGHLIVACPNFLSITNSYHDHTRGVAQKLKNIGATLYRLATSKGELAPMRTTEREVFQPDDDACVLTNPIDLQKWAKNNGLQVVSWSGRSFGTSSDPIAKLDRGIFRNFLGSILLVVQKPI